jgi:hypothetical protein
MVGGLDVQDVLGADGRAVLVDSVKAGSTSSAAAGVPTSQLRDADIVGPS